MDSFLSDLRFAWRTLRRTPAFTLAAVVTLALGIGANTALFSVIRGVLLKPLPYHDEGALVRLQQQTTNDSSPVGFSPVDVEALKERTRTLTTVAEYHSMWFILLGKKEPERVQTGVVSSAYFDLLGVQPILGRGFTAADEKPGAEPVLLLSNRYWQRSFASDPKVLNRAFRMNDHVHTVVGVLPPLPAYPDDNDVYMPVSACPFRMGENTVHNPQARMLAVIARTKPGTRTAAVADDLHRVSKEVEKDFPDAFPKVGLVHSAITLKEDMTGNSRTTLLVLLGATGLVLLIACANVANLILANLLRRGHELAMRTALGAGRARLMRQLVTESTLLSLVGGAAGVLLATRGVPLLAGFAARFTPRTEDVHLDAGVLLFALGVSLLTGIAAGLLPALPWKDVLAPSLLGGSRTTVGLGGSRLRGALVVAQVAVSFVLLIGAGLLLRSFLYLQTVDPGVKTEKVLTLRVALNFTRYKTPAQRLDFFERLLLKVQARPGVLSAAVSGTVPMDDGRSGRTNLVLEGAPLDATDTQPQMDLHVASPGYFAVASVPVLAGRAFDANDGPDKRVLVISRSVAEKLATPWSDVVGRRATSDKGRNWFTIVGVVGDVRNRLDAAPRDAVYQQLARIPLLAPRVFVRTAQPPEALSRSLVEAVYELDPEQPVDDIRTLDAVRENALAPPKLTAALLGIFAGVALLITAAGIGGVMAFSVGQRTQEIGVRMALGARRGDVLRAVLTPGLGLVVAGLALGLAGAVGLTRLMSSLLFGVRPVDPITFAAVGLVLAAVALVASFLPARRATAIEPMVALRTT